MHHLLTIFLIYLQLTDLTWLVVATEPYCICHKTEYTSKMVNKTREVLVAKAWHTELSTPATKIEYYEEEMYVPKDIPVIDCCSGYNMSKPQLCEPKCLRECPKNSKCVEPEVCKCNVGYFASVSKYCCTPFCKPICEKPCPEHSDCVDPNKCQCNFGFALNEETNQCEPNLDSSRKRNMTEVNIFKEYTHFSHEETFENTTWESFCTDTKVSSYKCADDFVFYRGRCRPQKFVRNENTYDCQIYIEMSKNLSPRKPWEEVIKHYRSDTGLYKFYSKYESTRKIIPMRRCCKGYEMSKLQLCEPKCYRRCPKNSKCVEPEVCKCMNGYFSSISQRGDKQCEPICISGCPWNGTCIAPNHCKCQEGYKSKEGTCIPICSLGDQCKNGICVDTNKCQCHLGFALNEETYKCELNLVSSHQETSNIGIICSVVVCVLVVAFALGYLVLGLMRAQTGTLDIDDKQLACAYQACADAEK